MRDRVERWFAVPSGRVKWYDAEKGFGFLSHEGGEDVYVRSDALPAGVDTLRPRQRVEFDMVSGRRGPQALRVVVHEEPTVAQDRAPRGGPRHSPDELHGMVEDMIKVLESTVQPELRRGHRPDHKVSSRVASVLRGVARELDA
ncbi:CspB [Dietzia sp. DQ12-45-1b]|nr:CspB [Dietzia sp. DQ12-45-1b]